MPMPIRTQSIAHRKGPHPVKSVFVKRAYITSPKTTIQVVANALTRTLLSTKAQQLAVSMDKKTVYR